MESDEGFGDFVVELLEDFVRELVGDDGGGGEVVEGGRQGEAELGAAVQEPRVALHHVQVRDGGGMMFHRDVSVCLLCVQNQFIHFDKDMNINYVRSF